MITHRERIENCLSGAQNDRPPVALWRHFPVDDQDPARLAKAALNYQQNFDFDLVKVTPASSFCLKDWGVEDEWQGHSEGTRKYTKRIIQHPEDWEKLKVLDPRQGALGAQLACLKTIQTGARTGHPGDPDHLLPPGPGQKPGGWGGAFLPSTLFSRRSARRSAHDHGKHSTVYG